MATTSTTKKLHTVLFPLPAAQGHMNPMIQLAKALASSGVHVTLVTVNHNLSRMLEIQQNSGLLKHHNIRFSGIPDSFLLDCERGLPRSRFAAIEQLEGAMEELLQKLLVEEPPITCLIDDCFVTWTRDVANRLNIPRLIFWPQSASVLAIYTHHDQIVSAIGHDPLDQSTVHCLHHFIRDSIVELKAIPDFVSPFRETDIFNDPRQHVDTIRCIPGVAPLHPVVLPYKLPKQSSSLPYVRKLLQNCRAHINEAVCVIGNTFDELEPQVCKSLPRFYGIGPMIPSVLVQKDNSVDTRTGTSFWDEEDCSEWLDMQPASSVMYVSFGSATKFSVAQIQEIARGLKASQQSFLWVIRPDSIIEKLTNISREALPGGFMEETKGKGKVIRWAAQSMVLSHGAVGGFFSHGGWNSTMESISAGVPLLGWPHITDQVTNCWMVAEEWGVGLELKKLESLEIEKAVRKLMIGEAAHIMKERACKLREAARRAHGLHGSSHNHLKFLVDHLLPSLTTSMS